MRRISDTTMACLVSALLVATPSRAARGDDSPAPPPGWVSVDRNPDLARAGIGLSFIGATAQATGSAISAAYWYQADRCNGFLCGLGYIGGATLGGITSAGGTLLALIGIPLWLDGKTQVLVPSTDPRARPTRPIAFVPRVDVGAAQAAPAADRGEIRLSATLSWDF